MGVEKAMVKNLENLGLEANYNFLSFLYYEKVMDRFRITAASCE